MLGANLVAKPSGYTFETALPSRRRIQRNSKAERVRLADSSCRFLLFKLPGVNCTRYFCARAEKILAIGGAMFNFGQKLS